MDPDDIFIFVDLRKFLPDILRERLQLRLGVLEASLSLKACGRELGKCDNPGVIGHKSTLYQMKSIVH